MQIALDQILTERGDIYVDVNNSCYMYVNAITKVKIYLGKIRQLAKNLPGVPVSDWVSGLFLWIPQGIRSILSIKVLVATPTSYCCTKIADQGISILSIQDSDPELETQVFLIQYPFPHNWDRIIPHFSRKVAREVIGLFLERLEERWNRCGNWNWVPLKSCSSAEFI